MKKIRALGLVLLAFVATHLALAEGTNLWRQSRYDEFEKGTVNFKFCPTANMLADGMTKPLPRPAFEQKRRSIGLTNLARNQNHD